MGTSQNGLKPLREVDLDVGTWRVVDLDNMGSRVVDLDVFLIWTGLCGQVGCRQINAASAAMKQTIVESLRR